MSSPKSMTFARGLPVGLAMISPAVAARQASRQRRRPPGPRVLFGEQRQLGGTGTSGALARLLGGVPTISSGPQGIFTEIVDRLVATGDAIHPSG
jgi:hypothetical protein